MTCEVELHELVHAGFEPSQMPPGFKPVVDAFDYCIALLATPSGPSTWSACRLKPALALAGALTASYFNAERSDDTFYIGVRPEDTECVVLRADGSRWSSGAATSRMASCGSTTGRTACDARRHGCAGKGMKMGLGMDPAVLAAQQD